MAGVGSVFLDQGLPWWQEVRAEDRENKHSAADISDRALVIHPEASSAPRFGKLMIQSPDKLEITIRPLVKQATAPAYAPSLSQAGKEALIKDLTRLAKLHELVREEELNQLIAQQPARDLLRLRWIYGSLRAIGTGSGVWLLKLVINHLRGRPPSLRDKRIRKAVEGLSHLLSGLFAYSTIGIGRDFVYELRLREKISHENTVWLLGHTRYLAAGVGVLWVSRAVRKFMGVRSPSPLRKVMKRCVFWLMIVGMGSLVMRYFSASSHEFSQEAWREAVNHLEDGGFRVWQRERMRATLLDHLEVGLPSHQQGQRQLIEKDEVFRIRNRKDKEERKRDEKLIKAAGLADTLLSGLKRLIRGLKKEEHSELISRLIEVKSELWQREQKIYQELRKPYWPPRYSLGRSKAPAEYALTFSPEIEPRCWKTFLTSYGIAVQGWQRDWSILFRAIGLESKKLYCRLFGQALVVERRRQLEILNSKLAASERVAPRFIKKIARGQVDHELKTWVERSAPSPFLILWPSFFRRQVGQANKGRVRAGRGRELVRHEP